MLYSVKQPRYRALYQHIFNPLAQLHHVLYYKGYYFGSYLNPTLLV